MPASDLLDSFVEYLRAGRIPDAFLPAYRSAAQGFLIAYERVPLLSIGKPHVDHYIESYRNNGTPERALKNLRIACEVLLAFLEHQRSEGAESRSPGGRRTNDPSAQPRDDRAGRRQFTRVPFIQDIEVVGVGMHRSSDLSVGGMYLEAVHSFGNKAALELRFKLPDGGPPLSLKANVAYTHAGAGVGVMFVDLSPDDRSRIVAFITKSARGA